MFTGCYQRQAGVTCLLRLGKPPQQDVICWVLEPLSSSAGWLDLHASLCGATLLLRLQERVFPVPPHAGAPMCSVVCSFDTQSLPLVILPPSSLCCSGPPFKVSIIRPTLTQYLHLNWFICRDPIYT